MPPVGIFRNFENIFVDLGTAEVVRNFVLDLAAISKLGSVGLVVTEMETDNAPADFVSRYFAAGAGIPENPVTGSIHATLVPYWAAKLGRDRLMGFQASARGGWLDCELTEERVLLSGNASRSWKRLFSFLKRSDPGSLSRPHPASHTPPYCRYGVGSTLSMPFLTSKCRKAGLPCRTTARACPRATVSPFFTLIASTPA